MSNKRVRGVAIHRPILYGSTSTPLTPAEKLAAPPDHTHKWTVAVRSAASHPLPSLAAVSGISGNTQYEQGSEISAVTAALGHAPGAGPSASTSASATSGTGTISTRGRDQEHDYHKMVGGKDDISHFIKRVQFKLHDTYPQPTRNIDKPPFSVTETGWGEFEIQIKIFFVPEANEKPVSLFHHLKLHPWLNSVTTGVEPAGVGIPPAISASAPQNDAQKSEDDTTRSMEIDEPPKDSTAEDTTMSGSGGNPSGNLGEAQQSSATKPILPPVVHSWQYDEIVFPEPMEPFYDILTTHPPTPLPSTSAQAFADASAYQSYQSAQNGTTTDATQGPTLSTPIPPHPLHTPTGYLFDALSFEAQQAEADRLDLARIAAVKELEKGRDQLIKAEKALKQARNKVGALNVAATSTNANRASSAAVVGGGTTVTPAALVAGGGSN